jgi:NADH:ubiquinone oxidoreductase subunit 6 (subunit J)
MNLRRVLLILLFFGLVLTFITQNRLGEVVSYISTKEIASSLFYNFSYAMLVAGLVISASILGALYLVSEGK